MINTKQLIVGLAVMVGAVSCDPGNVKETPSGLKYTLVESGEGEMPVDGNYLLLNMRYSDGEDSVWVDTYERGPIPLMKQDSVWKNGKGSIEQVFMTLKKGDSVVFDITAEDLFTNTWKQPMPEGVEAEELFTFEISVDDVLDEEGIRAWQQEMMAEQRKKMQEMSEEQLAKDIETIEAYLAENDIEATKTESGLFYQIIEEGEGELAQKGDNVQVRYIGKLLDGQLFDTNVKSLAEAEGIYSPQREPYGPLEFQIGSGRVIKGWEEGFTYLKEGSKAKLFVPSPLAYGPRQTGPIGPNSILVFEVTLEGVN